MATDELLVHFPAAGGEVYLDDELDLIEAAPPDWQPPPVPPHNVTDD
ncbi:hypothetical protein [Streptomyces spectabilis]|uniref:Uncharacterized protein n=1 Tax=Streptomyces spectabilis TaxID=68270 RepID=A0A7W8B318_STRST|nr:hypothetical protein [Streptomyces spectabilis]MBB5109440.1 hypothetical protein [Streptomyces spectabilis]MCI3907789.1 hypothetical protein [Streptomyces spectabilis]